MVSDSWHSQFAPSSFLRSVSVEHLLAKNDVDSEASTDTNTGICVLCNERPPVGIKLNNGSFLCESCLRQVSRITYPERYEAAHRHYLAQTEAQRLAWSKFKATYEYDRHRGLYILLLAFLLLALSILHLGLLPVSFALFITGDILRNAERRKREQWIQLSTEWTQANPPPAPPTLLHFHDPQAQLTPRDRCVLRIFNHWPGYPPFWSHLRHFVKKRDSDRCQVTGCPSRLSLHVHHLIPTSVGGPHTPDNLITLCEFHHALEPDNGHQRIWNSVQSRYFTLVGGHHRGNRNRSGTHLVRPHLRRLELVSLEDLRSIHEVYGFRCPTCEQAGLKFEIRRRTNTIHVHCPECGSGTEGPQQLAEESGPRLAELLLVSRSHGRWRTNWEMLERRREATWTAWMRTDSPGRPAVSGRIRRRKAKKRRGFVLLEP